MFIEYDDIVAMMNDVAGADPVPAGAHPEVLRREAGKVRHAVRHRILVQDVRGQN